MTVRKWCNVIYRKNKPTWQCGENIKLAYSGSDILGGQSGNPSTLDRARFHTHLILRVMRNERICLYERPRDNRSSGARCPNIWCFRQSRFLSLKTRILYAPQEVCREAYPGAVPAFRVARGEISKRQGILTICGHYLESA